MKNMWLWIIVVVVVLGAAYYFMKGKSSSTVTTVNTDCPTPAAKTVDFCGGAFTTITVNSGDTVTFRNDTSNEIQVDSNPHPTHTDNTQLNIGPIEPGQSKTVTLTNKGTWGFHNHLNPSDHGSITVQ